MQGRWWIAKSSLFHCIPQHCTPLCSKNVPNSHAQLFEGLFFYSIHKKGMHTIKAKYIFKGGIQISSNIYLLKGLLYPNFCSSGINTVFSVCFNFHKLQILIMCNISVTTSQNDVQFSEFSFFHYESYDFVAQIRIHMSCLTN